MGQALFEKKAKPFLKWAGGKTQVLSIICQKIPYREKDIFIFIEPFVGSGAVLFDVLQKYPNIKKAVINDINTDLMNTYNVIKNNVHKLIKELKKYQEEYYALEHNLEQEKEYYYRKRDIFNNRQETDIVQATLFIFLNRTCFNGLFRVNSSNNFNVPIGRYKKPQICNEENLLLVSNLLRNVIILNDDYEKTIEYIDTETLFYLDPPYKPLSQSSSFTSYTKNGFDDNEQIRLKDFCDQLSINKCKWILSNSDVKDYGEGNFFDELYKDYTIDRVEVRRSINADASRRNTLNELVISYGGR